MLRRGRVCHSRSCVLPRPVGQRARKQRTHTFRGSIGTPNRNTTRVVGSGLQASPVMPVMSGRRDGSVHVTATPPRVSVLGAISGTRRHGSRGGAGLLTGILIMSCVLMAVLFTVLASWMQDHALHRSARANLTAAGCCAL